MPHPSQSHREGWDRKRFGHKASTAILSTLVVLLLCALPLKAQTPLVLRLTLHDTIQPITAAYLQRGFDEAARRHAALVIVSLGTPGGLLDSTRTIVQSIETSAVPVAIYISPSGSRAGSAGFFLLEAADIAAMAPGTNAGAAHPVLEGGSKDNQMDPILKQKIENDTAAFLRSYVTRRNRNAEAAEDAVRNSKSYSDTEALSLHLIDTIAPDEAALIRSLDGKEIHRFNGNTSTLHLTNATVEIFAPSLREKLLTRLANPNFAVLLLVLGGLLIYLEFNVPGTIVPGALGTLSVLLALFGLNLLPVRHTAVLLLVAALLLLILELKFTSHGILAAVGIASLIFGLATLVDAPIPELRVHLAIAVAAGLGFGVISFGLAWLALRARRSKVLLGPEAMIGRLAIARTPLNPTGQVEVRGELWQAHLQGSTHLPAGSPVLVTAIHDLTLLVEPKP
ncbi:nodulation protein NfeD [Granulicella sp. dw_53]|uniref:NfeD family protein n=1 Tax=Granulicella sp. dw_53 TaxID=2719792 RepID=UPI0031F6CCDE